MSSRSEQLALALLCGWGIARRRRGSDCLVLRTRRPPQGMECGHRDGSVHRRIRSRRLCDAPRPGEACPHPHVGTGGIAGVAVIVVITQIPNGSLIYSVAALVIFAGLTSYDFQRLRNPKDIRTAPLLAASIFLDILNVFLLSVVRRQRRVTLGGNGIAR